MNSKRPFYILFPLFIFLFACSCEQENTEDLLNLTVAWKANKLTFGSYKVAIDRENSAIYTGVGSKIVKVDTNNGNAVWRTPEIIDSAANLMFDDAYVYGVGLNPDRKGADCPITFVKLDKTTGETLCSINIGNGWGKLTRMYSYTFYNGMIYWGDKDSHFVYSCSTDTDGKATPIWGSEDVTADVMGDIVPYNGKLYFTYTDYLSNDEKPLFLVVIDPADNNRVVAEKRLTDKRYYGLETNEMQFHDGNLFIRGMGMICLNPETLETVWEISTNGGYRGFTMYKNCIYTSESTDYTSGVVCIDAKTGKLLWRKMLDTSFYGTIGYTPQVYEGYVYQPMQECIVVLNAKDGKYVGRDESIRTGCLALGVTERYNDLMIFSTLEKKIYAVKMDMHNR